MRLEATNKNVRGGLNKPPPLPGRVKIWVVTSVRLRVQYQAQDYGGGFLFNIRVVTSVRPRVRYLVQD